LKSTVSRALTRVGVATLVGLLAATAFASPAAADDGADLSIAFAGTTIAPFAGEKFGKVTISNAGPGTATGVELTFDISALTTSEVQVGPDPDCTPAGTEVTCVIDDAFAPPPGGDLEFLIPLALQAGASGSAGSLTATVSSATTDPDTSNNSKTVAVNVAAEPGTDLLVLAADVYTSEGDPIPPGASGELLYAFFNQGDLAAVGVKVVVILPEHVTFASTLPECTYSADNRVATCTYDSVFLPFSVDPSKSGMGQLLPVNVASDAPGPAALPGGIVTAAAIDVQQPDVPEIRPLPGTARWLTPEEIADIDPGDDEDPFAVFIAGDLPVTGSRTALYAVSGAGLLLMGALIVLLARRRRRAVTVA
jgi:LPXTG-motif cell wall-anchored protein